MLPKYLHILPNPQRNKENPSISTAMAHCKHRNTVNIEISPLSNYSSFFKLAVFLIIAPEIFSDFFPACI